jgi:hypothetical protein
MGMGSKAVVWHVVNFDHEREDQIPDFALRCRGSSNPLVVNQTVTLPITY